MENASKLEKLPRETLQHIARYLHATHRPSLYSFGLVNKTCYSATFPSVFREIHLAVRDGEALQGDVDALVKVLSRTGSARYVRSLSIKGYLRVDNGEETGPDMSYDRERAIYWYKLMGFDEVLGDDEPLLHGWHCNRGPVEVTAEEDRAWAPVVHFVRALPHLTTLVYDCRNQFPPSLLDVLHSRHPQCRLHHLTFRLRSLRWDTPDRHEMAIATSPCLHRAEVRHAWRDSYGEDDFNEEAMLELVAGLAPNLKHLRMVYVVPILYSSVRRAPRAPWRGLPGFVPGRAAGSLTSLALVGDAIFSPELFQTWNKHTRFHSLRHLTLGGGFDCHRGLNDEAMTWIAENGSFPRLRTLRVCIERDDEIDERPEYAKKAIAFFRGLEPLEELSVTGSLEPAILDSILARHGCALRTLRLCPSENPFAHVRPHIPMILRKEHIEQIQAQCPLLQNLAVPVKRTKSDSLEADMYKSFGKLERLQSLDLTLDCSDWRVMRDTTLADDPSFDEDDRKVFATQSDVHLKRGHIREAFMNCAVDEVLARSIGETIWQAKVGTPLRSLKLYTTGACSFGDTVSHCDTREFVEHLSRSYLIQRSVRDDGDENTILVRELGRQARETRDKMLTENYARRAEDFHDCSAVHVFRRVWPPKEGSKDWRDDWVSLPLQS
ncbi:hypothetical protein VP1G_08510 [Cytospora mali]|uniref:F-box domain-containing protein n=1 Tax=Cytospora mali TaxID=578113 RepID=A0A194VBG9_CYTMA|nr:hypothetical protein VP1G_08510 [Valsa mali var. pyri (nom. inval.)]